MRKRDRRAEWKVYYAKNRERLLAKGRVYRQSDAGKEAQKRAYEKRKTDPEKRQQRKDYSREYSRRYMLPVSGKRIRVQKRGRPDDNCCELCGVKREFYLQYHHWDDEHPEKGIWVCGLCHNAVERYEKGILGNYLELKEQIEENYLWSRRE